MITAKSCKLKCLGQVLRHTSLEKDITCSTVVSRDSVQCHSYGARQNSTLRNFVLLRLIITKLGVIDYISDPYSDANFR